MADSKKREYPASVGAMWKRGNFTFASMPIDAKMFDALQACKVGGTLQLRLLKDESRKGPTSPHGYLEFLTPKQVAAEKEAYQKFKSAPAQQTDDSL